MIVGLPIFLPLAAVLHFRGRRRRRLAVRAAGPSQIWPDGLLTQYTVSLLAKNQHVGTAT